MNNILLDKNYNLKIIDFGFCTNFKERPNEQMTSDIGTPMYLAPEV